MMSASEPQQSPKSSNAEDTLQFLTEEESRAASLSNSSSKEPLLAETNANENKSAVAAGAAVAAAAAVAGKMNMPANLQLASPVMREWISKRREGIRPWGTFVNTSNFGTPQSVPKLSKRLYKNVDHFQSNYFFVFIVLFLYCLLTSPLLLIVLAANAGGCYILNLKQKERKLTVGGREISLGQQYAAVALCSVPLFLIAGAGSAVFWVIGASFFFIGIHAAFYNFDALDVEDEDAQKLTGAIVEEV